MKMSIMMQEPPLVPTFAAELHKELNRVVPIAMAEATDEARESLEAVAPTSDGAKADPRTVHMLAAALGGAAVDSIALGLAGWMESILKRRAQNGWPKWLRPALVHGAEPKLVTLTKFTQERSKYVRELDDGRAVLLTRRGTVVAALVPVQPGSYEQEAYPVALAEAYHNARQARADAGFADHAGPLTDHDLEPASGIGEVEATAEQSSAPMA